jgi:hypothetical protein
MAYLERSYRRTNVYTNYHRQLENQCLNYNNLPEVPTHNPLPTAPPIAEVVSVETINKIEEDPELYPVIDAKLVPE